MRVAERAAVPTRPTFVAEMALRPSKAPRIELPMDTAVCIFCCESWLCSRSRRSSARRIWSCSCCSLTCQRLRSSATAASRFSRAASARRARKSPSDSPAFEAALNASHHSRRWRAPSHRDAPAGSCAQAGVAGGAQCGARQLAVFRAFGRRGGEPRLELRHRCVASSQDALPPPSSKRRQPCRRSATHRGRASHRRSAASQSPRSWACRAARPAPCVGGRKYSGIPAPTAGRDAPARPRPRLRPR